MVSMKEILDKNPKYDHKEHTKKQRDSFKILKEKTKKFLKDYFSKDKYINPRKVQKPDNLDF